MATKKLESGRADGAPDRDPSKDPVKKALEGVEVVVPAENLEDELEEKTVEEIEEELLYIERLQNLTAELDKELDIELAKLTVEKGEHRNMSAILRAAVRSSASDKFQTKEMLNELDVQKMTKGQYQKWSDLSVRQEKFYL